MKYLLFVMMIIMSTKVVADAHSTITVPMTCAPTENMIEKIKNTYKEDMAWVGAAVNSDGHQLIASLWVNSETQSWTMIQSNKERNISCLLSFGKGFTQFSLNTVSAKWYGF